MPAPIKIGIEIEYHIADRAGKPVHSGYGKDIADIERIKGLQILKAAAAAIDPTSKPKKDRHGHVRWDFRDGSSIMPDTFSLLETVTGASTDLDCLRDQLWRMKSALSEAAQKMDCVVSGAACPVGYKYEDLRGGNVMCNNAGMHIHMDAAVDRIKIKLANMLAQIIPELAAIGANSPVYDRKLTGYASKRLKVSPLAGAEAVEVLTLKDDNPLQFDDPSKRYRFVTQFTKSRKTIELRGFDTPINIDWAMAIAALVQCIGVKAARLFIDEKRNTVVGKNKKLRGANFDAAVKDGFTASFRPDKSMHMRVKGDARKTPFLYHCEDSAGKKVPVPLAVKRLLYYVEREAYELGVTEYLQPLYDAVRTGDNQAMTQRKWFQGGGYGKFVRSLQARAKRKPVNGKSRPDGKRCYLTARQIARGASPDSVYLTSGGLKRIGVGEGDTVVVSGPLKSIKAIATLDKTAAGKIPLGDDEVKLGLKARNGLGLSLYDPVIIGTEECRPIVIERTDASWFHTAVRSGKGSSTSPARELVVHKGFTDLAPSVAIAPQEARALGLSDGDQACVSGPGGKSALVQIAVMENLKQGIAAMMEKSRNEVGVELGGKIKLQSAPEDEQSNAGEQLKLVVAMGDRDDFDADPPVIRLHPLALSALNLEDGARGFVLASSGGDKGAYAVLMKKDKKGRKRNEAGMVKKTREMLGVNNGDSIVLQAGRPDQPAVEED